MAVRPDIISPTKFIGSISGNGVSVAVNFEAQINGNGVLRVDIEPLDLSTEIFTLNGNPRPGRDISPTHLHGASSDGQTFNSESCFIVSIQTGPPVVLKVECHDADIERQNNFESMPYRRWWVRNLSGHGILTQETRLGVVSMAGTKAPNADLPDGSLFVQRSPEINATDWEEKSSALLTHLATVLSFAGGSYIRPVLDEYTSSTSIKLRVNQVKKLAPGRYAPFHHLDMGSIFNCACKTFFTHAGEIEKLDPAIRWLTAEFFYDESLLIHAMSALENIVDGADLKGAEKFMTTGKFDRLAKKVRQLLRDENAPSKMEAKVAELNRVSLAEKVQQLAEAWQVSHDDFPSDWLKQVVGRRNEIIHTGMPSRPKGEQTDTIQLAIWAREIVIRMILSKIGFAGRYQSWLHACEMRSFPQA